MRPDIELIQLRVRRNLPCRWALCRAAGGAGYEFAAGRIIELDALNPQVAARVARAFDRWRKFDAGRQVHARAALEGILSTKGLSRDTLVRRVHDFP